jgi:hypothetical protein
MLHDSLDILFVADMHEATRRQAIFDDHIKEDFDGWDLECTSNLGDPLPGISSQR